MIPPSPDQIRDAIERQTGPGMGSVPSRAQLEGDKLTIIAAARAFADHMETVRDKAALDQFKPIKDQPAAHVEDHRLAAGFTLSGTTGKPQFDPCGDAPSPQWQIDELRKRLNAQKVVTADMAAKLEDVVRRLDAMHGTDHEVEKAPIETGTVSNIEYRVDLGKTEYGMLLDRFEKLEASMSQIADTGRRADIDLASRIKNLADRIVALEASGVAEMPKSVIETVSEINNRLDRIAIDLATKATSATLDLVNDRINDMRTHLPAGPRLSGKPASELTAADFRAFHSAHDGSKRTIKGGWFNIYRGDYGLPVYDGPFSRELADTDAHAQLYGSTPRTRIACILIPDFTEGDGL